MPDRLLFIQLRIYDCSPKGETERHRPWGDMLTLRLGLEASCLQASKPSLKIFTSNPLQTNLKKYRANQDTPKTRHPIKHLKVKITVDMNSSSAKTIVDHARRCATPLPLRKSVRVRVTTSMLVPAHKPQASSIPRCYSLSRRHRNESLTSHKGDNQGPTRFGSMSCFASLGGLPSQRFCEKQSTRAVPFRKSHLSQTPWCSAGLSNVSRKLSPRATQNLWGLLQDFKSVSKPTACTHHASVRFPTHT